MVISIVRLRFVLGFITLGLLIWVRVSFRYYRQILWLWDTGCQCLYFGQRTTLSSASGQWLYSIFFIFCILWSYSLMQRTSECIGITNVFSCFSLLHWLVCILQIHSLYLSIPFFNAFKYIFLRLNYIHEKTNWSSYCKT